MALEDILNAMEREVEAEIKSLDEQSAATAFQVRRAAENDARVIRERHHREILVPLQQERARRLNRARLAALRATSRAREKLYVQALACARERLAGLRTDPDYSAILYALLEEALAEIRGDAVVRADPRDDPVLRSLHARYPSARFESDLQTCGGVEARTPDGRIRVVNTVEGRLEQAQNLLRQKVMPLFGDE
jgi:vacuolar-type H+-ATPase subunit E/Vma4